MPETDPLAPLRTAKAWWLYRLLPSLKAEVPENRRVLHGHHCAFVHIPKTAGNSVAAAMEQFPIRNGPEHPKVVTPKHAKATEHRRILGRRRWEQYFSFAFIRNPWDLMVSSYNWWLQKSDRHPHLAEATESVRQLGSFSAFLSSPWGLERLNQFEGNIDDWIMDGDEIIVDFVGRFENLDEDWKKICRKLNVEHVPIPHHNRTRRKTDYRSYYVEETKELVGDRFSRFNDIFGYEF